MNRGSTDPSHLSIAFYSKCKGGAGSGEFSLFSSGERHGTTTFGDKVDVDSSGVSA
jgi:hypothetical protein